MRIMQSIEDIRDKYLCKTWPRESEQVEKMDKKDPKSISTLRKFLTTERKLCTLIRAKTDEPVLSSKMTEILDENNRKFRLLSVAETLIKNGH